MIYWLLWWYGSSRETAPSTFSLDDNIFAEGDILNGLTEEGVQYYLVKDIDEEDKEKNEITVHLSTLNDFGVILVRVSILWWKLVKKIKEKIWL